jgi:hypothetical protein
MTAATDIPVLTAHDLIARALAASQAEQAKRQRQHEAEEARRDQERRSALADDQIKFRQEMQDLWIALAGAAPDIPDEALIHDGKNWLWQFQPGVTVGVGTEGSPQSRRYLQEGVQRVLQVHTTYNRSSYFLDSLAALGTILQNVAEAHEKVAQQQQERQQADERREREQAEKERRQAELEQQMTEIEAREPRQPAPVVVFFEDGAAGVQVSAFASSLQLCPFRVADGAFGPMWEFDLSPQNARDLLSALESRTETQIAACGRLIVTHPAGRGVDRPDEVLWMQLPSEYDTDYTTRDIQGQVMVQRGVDTAAFKGALGTWLDYITALDAWAAELHAARDSQDSLF